MGGFSGSVNLMTELVRQTAKLSWTGDTAETIVLTVNIPPLGIKSYLDISSLWSMPNNSNNKIVRVRLGGIAGTVLMQWTATTIASVTDIHRIVANRGATNSQVCTNALVFGATSSGVPNTTSIETNAGTTLVFTVQNASAGDTTNLEYAVVNLVM